MATVLIIDDSHLGRTHASLALRDTPHRVLIAHDGVEALAMFVSAKPDCVVLNQHTLALSTEELIDRIRAKPNSTSIIVRGTELTQSSQDAYRARGAAVVLSAPRDREAELLSAIESCVGQSPISRAG